MTLSQFRFSHRMIALTIGCLAALVLATGNISIGQPPKPSGTLSAPNPKPGAVQKDRKLQAFMRKKLAASNQILEGLCIDDMKLVAQGARSLHDLSDGEQWHVRNDVMYKQFSSEFRQITDDLIEAAENDKPDRVALKWVDATVSCLDCHRFVRGIRVAD